MENKQVTKNHYKFSKYVVKQRWISLWHQLDEVIALKPSRVLEIGPGPGLFKAIVNHFDISVETLDIDPDLNPDHVASAQRLPFDDNSYDCVCAFQLLEHLPYEHSLKAFSEMIRVAKRHVVISLPDAKAMWTYTIHIPKIGPKTFHIPKPGFRPILHKFNGEHYWEINTQGYPLKKIIADFTKLNIKMIKTYRVDELTWHRFFVFKHEETI